MDPKPINTLATWTPIAAEGLDIKSFQPGYPYKKGELVLRSTLETPVNRYAKNYEKDVKRFSLCIISTESNAKRMEEWLDKQSEHIKGEDVTGNFNLLGVVYEPKVPIHGS